jgi:hypothetical protein
MGEVSGAFVVVVVVPDRDIVRDQCDDDAENERNAQDLCSGYRGSSSSCVEGLTRLQRHWSAVDLHRLCRFVLLRCDEVTRNARPVIDQDAGLQLPRDGEQLLRAPGGCAFASPPGLWGPVDGSNRSAQSCVRSARLPLSGSVAIHQPLVTGSRAYRPNARTDRSDHG